MALHVKIGNARFTTVPLPLHQIKNKEGIVGFRGLYKCLIMIIPICFPAAEMRSQTNHN